MKTNKKNRGKQVKLKEIRIRPKIGEHDLKTKLKQTRKFLDKGCQVRVTVMYRGREQAVSKDLAEEKLARFLELGTAMGPAKWSGRNYTVVIR